MTAIAARRGCLPPAVSLAAVLLVSASPAAAQAGAAISLFSDDRFRGYSLSAGRPVGIIDLSYDAPDGFYGAISGSAVATRHEGLQPLGLVLNAGYAKAFKSGMTLDLGVIRSNYSHYSTRANRRSYTEIYAGLSGKLLAGRVYLSPDYLRSGEPSAYGELEGNLPLGDKFRLTGHAGVLVPLRERSEYQGYRPEFDWRLGIARQLGRVSLQAAWTGTGNSRERDPYRSHGGNALVVGLSWVP